MKTSQSIRIFLILLAVYLFIGAVISFLSQTGNAPDNNTHATFIFFMVAGPLIIIFAFLGIPGIGLIIGGLTSIVLFVKRQYLFATTILLTFVILILTMLLPSQSITENFNYSAVHWGYPFHFIRQDMGEADGAPLGWHLHYGMPLENPTDILWGEFAASFLIVFAVVFGVGYGTKFIVTKSRQLSDKPIQPNQE